MLNPLLAAARCGVFPSIRNLMNILYLLNGDQATGQSCGSHGGAKPYPADHGQSDRSPKGTRPGLGACSGQALSGPQPRFSILIVARQMPASLTDRRGVNAVEDVFLNGFGWAFRGQAVNRL